MEANLNNVNSNLSDVITKVNDRTLAATNQNKPVDKVVIEENNIQYVDGTNKTENANKENLSAAIDIISSFIEPQIRNVNFTQDESSGKTVVKVFDTQSKELIKQFPSEEVLELSEKIKGLQNEIANKTGILIDDKV